MSLRPVTLRGRLILWYSAVLAAMLALSGGASLMLLDRSLQNNIDSSLDSVGQTVAGVAQQTVSPELGLDETLESLLGAELAQRFYELLDPSGRPDQRLRTRRRGQLPLTIDALRNAAQGIRTFETLPAPGGKGGPLRLLTLPVVRDGRVVNIVQVAASLESVDAARRGFLLVLLGLTPLALAGSAIGGWFLARRALAPVDALVESARKIEAEDLSQRLPAPPGRDELGRLAEVLNDMLGRLDRSFNAVRRFSGDAAHELRTPLTIIKGEIEVALRSSADGLELRRTLESCLEEVDRLNSLIEDLLLMTRMDGNALSLALQTVDLAEVLREVTPAVQALAEKAESQCAVVVASPLWVRGYESLLFRLIFNLAENAVKFTPAGGKIDITAKLGDGAAILEVRDNGLGIPADQQERIFERLYRGDPAREGSGTGLGLALVRSITQLHKGKISLSSAPGEGACFHVELPLAAPPSAPAPSKD
jgi:heavy metal sensor kinase